MNEAQKAVRTTIKEVGIDQFVKDNKRDELEDVARTFGASDEDIAGFSNKAEVGAFVEKKANLPNPALRGKSKIDSPVARAWQMADEMHAAATEENPVKRKDVVAVMQAEGIAYYTARTQYQAFFTATNKGTRRLADVPAGELPKALQPAPEVEA